MSTQEQRAAIRASRTAAGEAYAAAAQALASAYVDLAAHDEVCGTASMGDGPGIYPAPPPRFLLASRTDAVHLQHDEFAPQAAAVSALEYLVRVRVAELHALLA